MLQCLICFDPNVELLRCDDRSTSGLRGNCPPSPKAPLFTQRSSSSALMAVETHRAFDKTTTGQMDPIPEAGQHYLNADLSHVANRDRTHSLPYQTAFNSDSGFAGGAFPALRILNGENASPRTVASKRKHSYGSYSAKGTSCHLKRRRVTDRPVDDPRSRLLLWSWLVVRKSKCSCEAGPTGAAIPISRKRSKESTARGSEFPKRIYSSMAASSA